MNAVSSPNHGGHFYRFQAHTIYSLSVRELGQRETMP
jgi:hypothetical protein